MKDLAHENLEAARILLDRGLLHAAASRLYFAFFQAGVFALARAARTPEDARKGLAYWSHEAVGDLVHLSRGRDDDSVRFKRLQDLRVRADYDRGPVARREVEEFRHEVVRFVREVTA
ncbi:MAG TPA: hypothetical protein VFI25_17570 [Planctomycetota bacterium]|nr:hypothetical protein [Planctomycetota bacterium]